MPSIDVAALSIHYFTHFLGTTISLHNKQIIKLAKADCSSASIDDHMGSKLLDNIELHKKQCADWDNYTDDHCNEIKKLSDKHHNELENFEKDLYSSLAYAILKGHVFEEVK